jgi:chemotaxis protein CheZ
MGAADRDSDDLEALFESLATHHLVPGAAIPAAVQPTPPVASTLGAHETATDLDLEIEFPEQASASNDEIIQRIGLMTRQLHDNLRALGYHSKIQEAAQAIPDTRQRLDYVADLTGKAAERVLTLTEISIPMQDGLARESEALAQRWQKLMDNELSVDEFKALVEETRGHLSSSQRRSRETAQHLRDIMMAQDFHDLTGQVLRKVTEMASTLEIEMVQLLIDSAPPETRAEIHQGEGLINGPVINPDGRSDIVANQAQVDDLLATLGF